MVGIISEMVDLEVVVALAVGAFEVVIEGLFSELAVKFEAEGLELMGGYVAIFEPAH